MHFIRYTVATATALVSRNWLISGRGGISLSNTGDMPFLCAICELDGSDIPMAKEVYYNHHMTLKQEGHRPATGVKSGTFVISVTCFHVAHSSDSSWHMSAMSDICKNMSGICQ